MTRPCLFSITFLTAGVCAVSYLLVSSTAQLNAAKMSLAIGDKPANTEDSPGRIPSQPQDRLSIGFDGRTAAGDYQAPNRVNGNVNLHEVSTSTQKQDANNHITKRPNFVFVITDDISPDDLGVYGNPFVKTPNLDRLASTGLVFDNAYLTISSCSPSRCSIITGRYPHNTGAPELHTSLPESQTTFVQSLQEAGYHTVISGKNHMATPTQLGFDLSSDSKPAGSEKWVAHLKDRPSDKPFFCWFASHDAHFPFTPDSHAAEFAADEIEVPAMLYDGPGTRDQLAGYFHEVARSDYYVGQLLDELQRQDILHNTYFIYCSDNGRPFPRCKTYLYDSGIKTPLLISGPHVATGRTESIVSSIDLAPTILELAGVECPETVQGVSATAVLSDPREKSREVAFAERNWHVFQSHERAVRTGDWLYIWNAWPDRHNVSGESASFRFPAVRELWEAAEEGELSPAQALLTQKPQPAEMLFNVAADPNQFHNLAEDEKYRTTLQQMRGLLNRWKLATGDSVPENPTLDRQTLHGTDQGGKKKHVRGEFPGTINNSTEINASGPVVIHSELSDFRPKKFGDLTKPLFADPNYHGSCDPEIVWNKAAKEWFIYYTARRALREKGTYVGTPLGVISSPDLLNWSFRGYCSFDGVKGQPDNADTHWAPGVIARGNTLHMFATYKPSAEPPWGGNGTIRHYVAPLSDPIDGWKLADVPEFSQPDPIDVSVRKIGDEFRAYYRVGKGGGIQWATSPDLTHWEDQGKCPGVNDKDRGFGYQEAPYVFNFQDRYWMLTDPHQGLAVFHSKHGVSWTQQERILREPGSGPADTSIARHPSVAVIDGRAFIFYHTEPNRPHPSPPPEKRSPHQKISFLQMAELKIVDGQLVCDRNAKLTIQPAELFSKAARGSRFERWGDQADGTYRNLIMGSVHLAKS